MRTTYVIPGLLVLVAILNGAYGESEFEKEFETLKREWIGANFRGALCTTINPREQGNNVRLGTLPSYPETCGQVSSSKRFFNMLRSERSERLQTRISGGSNSETNQWPWIGAIGKKTGKPFGAATLVTDQFMITAAHLFEEEEDPCNWNVRLGERDLSNADGNHVDIEVQNIWVHPQYNEDTLENDIAVIRLYEPADTSSNAIGPVCLPSVFAQYPVGTTCYVAGWGAEVFGGPLSSTLRHIEVPILSETECEAMYPDQLVPGNICAGYSGGDFRGFCIGDNGGPLVCQNSNNVWDMVGVASWTLGCGDENLPGVFTSTETHRVWINAVIASYTP